MAAVLSVVVGMHQLPVGHDVATEPMASSAHGSSVHGAGSDEMVPSVMAEHLADHFTPGMPTGGSGACPDCADHLLTFGSCLGALTMLVLGWLLAPPRPSHVLPFPLPRLTPAVALSTVGRLVPPLRLAELSLLRT